MIGGFLGAGKTTAIARLARHYTDQGLRVGVVTNDQAFGLVDTENLRSQGFQVGEVPGACFCCKFDDLVETAAALGADGQPDIILTEPVGSCTDLVATVLRPLSDLFGDRYELGPLAVLCKPEHGRKILNGQSTGFSPQAAYIFLKQLEEAQLIVLNKVDRLSPEQQAELLALLRDRFPDKKILTASGTTGAGYDEFLTALAAENQFADPPLDIDYDIYAEGEAALGWLNCNIHFTSETPFALDTLIQNLITQLSETLKPTTLEPAHIKAAGELASADGQSPQKNIPTATAIANWTASNSPPQLSLASHITTTTANALLNARVHGDPEELAAHVQTAVTALAAAMNLNFKLTNLQHFRPSRPEPTHRYGTSIS